MHFLRNLPFRDLAGYGREDATRDAIAGLAWGSSPCRRASLTR